MLYDFTYMWNLKSKLMHICNKRETVTEAENKEVVDRGKETGRKEIDERD